MVTRLRRYSQIADVLIKYGFGIALEQLHPGTTSRRLFRRKAPVSDLSDYERIRLALEELGPTFIKFGQIVSTRREMLPPELIAELQKLTDKVPSLSFGEVQPTIEKYCGPINEVFEYLEETPIAAASLSQVHRGMLRDGTLVAVKVQRPGIEGLIEVDLAILQSFAERIESRYPEMKIYNPTGMVREFAIQIRRELDFANDGRNADRLRPIVSEVPHVRVPDIHWHYSGKRVLVMEYITGVRVDDVASIRLIGANPHDVANRGTKCYIKQILKYGFFHADPHGGNLLVDMSGDLVFLDFGSIAIIRSERKDAIITLLLGIIEDDVDEIVDSFVDLGVNIEDKFMESFKDDLYTILSEYSGQSIEEFDLSGLMNQIPGLLNRYHLQVPMNLMQVIKVIAMVLDTGKHLDPNFHFSTEVGPYIKEMEIERILSRDTIRYMAKETMNIVDDVLSVPKSLNRALTKATDGSINIDVAATDILHLSRSIDRASNKMLVGFVVGAIVIGSSMMLFLSPEETSVPYNLALFGYLSAFVIGVYSVYRVWKIPGYE
ncbi:ABC1 kinase family protein [Methanogenium organophilum]|uniref:AarF/UbiB family protein n=1 Tax=Methanogenium organophilum TaxID=2199 RepID=A0A9X9T9D8_METOG|nr:AarF/UbiB family protein [Methanogenium organophilum]WAI02007.1 AarF/UbiB family protein [Methanogenium organophilum]